jgi:hypothetical protein
LWICSFEFILVTWVSFILFFILRSKGEHEGRN